jgi:hypothetical protein
MGAALLNSFPISHIYVYASPSTRPNRKVLRPKNVLSNKKQGGGRAAGDEEKPSTTLFGRHERFARTTTNDNTIEMFIAQHGQRQRWPQ